MSDQDPAHPDPMTNPEHPLAAAKTVKDAEARRNRDRDRWIAAGAAAAGIGSAAIVAALLYTNKGKKTDDK